MNRGRTARALLTWALVWAITGAAGCDTCRAFEQPSPSILTLTSSSSGDWVLELAPKIAKDQQVNCDICPYWCTQFDLGPVPMDALIAAYRDLAHHYLRDASTPHDDSWRRLERLGCMAAAASADDQARFMALLRDRDMAVRHAAAIHCLGHGMATEEPLEVLRAIAASEDELALDARIKLLEHAGGVTIEL